MRFKPGSSPIIGKQAIAADNEKFHSQYPEFKVLKYVPDPIWKRKQVHLVFRRDAGSQAIRVRVEGSPELFQTQLRRPA